MNCCVYLVRYTARECQSLFLKLDRYTRIIFYVLNKDMDLLLNFGFSNFSCLLRQVVEMASTYDVKLLGIILVCEILASVLLMYHRFLLYSVDISL